MTKEKLLEELKGFHTHHDNRLKTLEFAIKGIAGDVSTSCVKLADCALDKWLGERKDVLLKLFGDETIKRLNALHEEWHEESEKVCHLANEHIRKHQSLITKMFGKKIPKMAGAQKDRALAYYANLKDLTSQIDDTFNRMTKRLNALPKEMFTDE